mgnify:CR=1 FL=1
MIVPLAIMTQWHRWPTPGDKKRIIPAHITSKYNHLLHLVWRLTLSENLKTGTILWCITREGPPNLVSTIENFKKQSTREILILVEAERRNKELLIWFKKNSYHQSLRPCTGTSNHWSLPARLYVLQMPLHPHHPSSTRRRHCNQSTFPHSRIRLCIARTGCRDYNHFYQYPGS